METRSAGLYEVLHTACDVVRLPWETVWQRVGSHRNPLKEREMTSIFFDRLSFAPRNEAVVADQ